MSALRVLLADDHPVVREGLKQLLEVEPDMEVVGEASDGDAACDAAVALAPDVVVLDVSMPGLSGAAVAQRITREAPAVKVLALTVHEEPVYVTQLLRAGAAGYVVKRAAPAELVRALRVIAAGGTYLDPAIAGSLVDGYLERIGPVNPQTALSDREREVVTRIARGFTNKEIAAALEISVKTVETYKARVADKLGVRSRAEIVAYAAARGWL